MVWKLRGEPVVVQALGSMVESWSSISPNEVSIKLRDSSIPRIVVRSVPTMMGFEPKIEFIGLIDIIPEERMREECRKLYQELKNLEFETEWSGLLGRTLVFKPYFEIQRSQRFIAGLRPKNDLINALKQSQALTDLIYETHPHEVYATLQSLDPSDLRFMKSEEEFLKLKADFYRNPSRITWIITVSKMLFSKGFLGHEKTYRGLVSILDEVSKITIEVTGRIQKNISDD